MNVTDQTCQVFAPFRQFHLTLFAEKLKVYGFDEDKMDYNVTA